MDNKKSAILTIFGTCVSDNNYIYIIVKILKEYIREIKNFSKPKIHTPFFRIPYSSHYPTLSTSILGQKWLITVMKTEHEFKSRTLRGGISMGGQIREVRGR
jgi:hypothetical protein